MVQFEKRGVPTVSFTAQDFVKDAQWSAEKFGCSGLPLAVVELPFTNRPPDAVYAGVDGAVDQVLAGLTKEVVPNRLHHGIVTLADEWLAIEGESEIDALEEMNRLFLQYGWSDGIPLRPPLERFLVSMLEGTTRSPEEVVAVLEPGFGKATVEKIAANAGPAG